MTTPQKTLTIQQAATLYGINVQNIRNWIKSDTLKAWKIGKKWYFETTVFESFIGLKHE